MEEPQIDLESEGEGCPDTRGMFFVSESSGAIVPARCARLSCFYCVHINAKKRSLAIANAQPTRAILLTQVGDDWATVRNRVKQLVYEVRKQAGPFELVYHVEPNPRGTGHHVHAWQRGAFIPQPLLSQVADGAGMGSFARINKIRTQQAAASYGLKGLGYGLKGAMATETRATYLRENGRRLTHQTRGFFLGPDGHPAPVRDAERAVSALGKDPGPWVLRAL